MFAEGGGVGPPAHLSFFGESPPLWSDAVALISVGGPHPLIPFLPVCTFYPGFYLPSISCFMLVLSENQRTSRRAGSIDER